MAGFVLQHMAIGLRRHGEIACRQRLVAYRQNLGGVLGAAMVMMVMFVIMARIAARERRHERLDLAFGNGAHETVHRLAVDTAHGA